MRFKIPVMSIQDTLVGIENNKEFITLKNKLLQIINKQRENYGIIGKGYKIQYDLEKRWYPIFAFNNVWLAEDFIKLLNH